MTAEELERLEDDGYRYELIEGVLHRMSPASFRPSNIAARITARIVVFADEHGLGEVASADGGYVLRRDPDTVLAPDVAFARTERLPSAAEQEHFTPVVPDLVVEVVSSSDSMTKVDDKVERYLAAGVPFVGVFRPRRRTVTGGRPNQPARLLREGDVLGGEEVPPGFRLSVSEIFRPTS